MSETVCVTVEQLREWMNAIMKTSIRHLSDPQEVQFFADQFRSLELAIAQAERLKDWRPKVGDLVRLKAMPGVKARIDDEKVCPYTDQMMYRLPHEGWRYLAELMPEEEE